MNNRKAVVAQLDESVLQALYDGSELEIDTDELNHMTMITRTSKLSLVVNCDAPASAIYYSLDSEHLTYVAPALQANVSSVEDIKPDKSEQVSNTIHPAAESATHSPVAQNKGPRALDKGKGKEAAHAHASTSTLPERMPTPNTRAPKSAVKKPVSHTTIPTTPAKKHSPLTATPSPAGSYNRKSSITSPVLKRSVLSPKPIKKASSPAAKRPNSAAPSELKYPLRTRVIQRLALRPSSISNLEKFLNRNHTQRVDHIDVTNIVRSCGIPIPSYEQTKYCLKPHVYAELMVDDWPFYNEEEKETVKYNIEEAGLILKKTGKGAKKRTHDDSDDQVSSSQHKKQKASSSSTRNASPYTPIKRPSTSRPGERSLTPTAATPRKATPTLPEGRKSITPSSTSVPPTQRRLSPTLAERRSSMATPSTTSSNSTTASSTTDTPSQPLLQQRKPALIKSQRNFNAYCERHEQLRAKYRELKDLLYTKYPEFVEILANEALPSKARSYQDLNEQYRSQLLTAYNKSGHDFEKVEALAADILYVRNRLDFLFKSMKISVEKYNYEIPR